MGTSVVFIDSLVAGFPALVSELDKPAEVHVLNAGSNGLDQIAAQLRGRTDIDSVHIISHGNQGALHLGNSEINSGNVDDYKTQLADIGRALTETGAIQLYGCNVAQGETGQAFVRQFAAATGASVAASADATGAEGSGGNWVLEAATGAIEAPSLSFEGYDGILAANTAPVFQLGDGRVSTQIGTSGYAYANSIALQADGRIVISGLATDLTHSVFAAARYNADGSLDASFDGDGKVITSVGVVITPGGTIDNDSYGYSSAVQADGKILVLGQSLYVGGNNVALVRYNGDGSLDAGFGGAGKLTTYTGASYGYGKSIAIQADGKILVAGYSFNSNADFTVLRYNVNGSLDESFDADGRLTTAVGASDDDGASIALQADGKILVAGNSWNGSNQDFSLVRYQSNGSLDTSFSGDGKLTTAIGAGDDTATRVALQADGKILVAGSSWNGSNRDFALARYNANGTPDTSFDGDGKLTTAIGTGDDYASRIVVQADGRILLIGSSSSAGNQSPALARYNPDGSLDLSFDGDGKLIAGSTGISSLSDVVLQPDGKMLVAGGGAGGFVLFRYNADGGLDASFGAADDAAGVGAIYSLGSQPIVLDGRVAVFDAELSAAGSYDGATIALVRRTGANAEDAYSAAAGSNLGALTQGGDLVLSGVTIGSVLQNSGGMLELGFNASANQAKVNETLHAIAYANTGGPHADALAFDWTFSDGNTSTQGSGGALDITTSSTLVINAAPSGSVTVTGNAAQGQTLTAANGLSDGDGLGTIGYQWQYSTNGSSWNNVANSTTSSFAPAEALVGQYLRVVAAYTDGHGVAESAASGATASVANLNDAPTGIVTVSGTAARDYALTASNTLTDADGLGLIGYLWQSSADGVQWSLIAGASSSSLAISGALVGQHIRAVANYVDGHGTPESVASSATASVIITTGNTAPDFSTLPPGIVTTPVGADRDEAHGIALQADGRILLAGRNYNGSNFDFALVRYNADGSLDTSFSGDGKLSTAIGASNDYAYSVTTQADGKILVAGQSNSGSSGIFMTIASVVSSPIWDMALARYNPDGSLDTTFSGDGKLTTAFGSNNTYGQSVALQADGKILVAGSTLNASSNFALVRYNSDGSFDTGFGSGGGITTDIGAGTIDGGHSVAVQANGKILVAGTSGNGSNDDFALVRYNADGSLDTSFSGDGKLTTAIGGGNDTGYSLAVQTDGKILLAGSSNNGSDDDFAVVRYNPDGSLDTSFSGDGKLSTAIGTGHDAANSIALQTDGKIVVAGYSWNGIDYDIALIRYNSDGSLDASFSGDGVLTTDASGVSDYGYSVAVQADGKIVVAGQSYKRSSPFSDSDFVVIRYNSDGSLDNSFEVASTGSAVPRYVKGGPAVVLDSSLAVNDYELDALNVGAGDYAGASVTVARHAGGNGDDVFGFALSGAVFSVSGNALQDGGQTFATYSQSGGTLTVTFTSAAATATHARVLDVLEHITYANTSAAPPAAVLIDWNFSDGNTGAQGTGAALATAGTTTVALAAVNNAPTVTNAIADRGTAEDAAFNFVVPANTFADVDAGDSLTWSATRTDGSALPAWLGFNAGTRSFSGTPADGDVGVVNLRVTARDTGDASASEDFALAVSNVNDIPSGTVGVGGTPTQGQTLTASHTLADGDGLGAIGYQWQADGAPIVGATGSSLVLTQAQVGKTISVTARYVDGHGTLEAVASAATDTVANVNDAPTIGNHGPRSFAPNQPLSLNLGMLFHDPDGDMLTFSASGLPGGLMIDAATGRISGTTPAATGVHHLTVTATDIGGMAASIDFDLGIVIGHNVMAQVQARSGAALPGATVRDTTGAATHKFDLDGSGLFADTRTDSPLTLSVERGTGDLLAHGKPVTAADALDALNLSVGLPAAQGASWKELIAADMNHDGRVTAADALEILKASVGINTIQPGWVFVPNDAAGLAGMNKNTVSFKDEWSLSSITAPVVNTFTGILVGDVNNSWLIPA